MQGVVKAGAEFLVNMPTARSQTVPTITSLSNGGFVVTWQDFKGTLGDADGSSIAAQLFGADGSKMGSEFLVNTETASDQSLPTITGLTNGGFVISWRDFSGTLGDASGASIKAQVFRADGTKVGSEFLVNTQPFQSQISPTITGLANGGFVVSWQDRSGTQGDSDGSSIKAQVFGADGTKVGNEFLVNTQTVGDQASPSITGLSNGGFVVTWQDFKGTLADSDGSIKTQVFSAEGAKVGSEFLVNSETVGGQYFPTIASLSNGGCVVSWADYGSHAVGDAEGSNIKAQVFDLGSAPVITSNGGDANASITVLENSTAVAVVSAPAPYAGATLRYSIVGGSDARLFEINGQTGALSFKSAPDFEATSDAGHDNGYDVTVQVSDGSLTDRQAIAVTVTDVVNELLKGTSRADTLTVPRQHQWHRFEVVI